MTTIRPRTIVISPNGEISAVNAVSVDAQLLTMADPQQTTATGLPRKRQRLTHLTPDERMMRRKLKNRVAAQLARDRKREKMTELDHQVADIRAENQRLMKENEALRKRTEELCMENCDLKKQLEQDASNALSVGVKSETLSPESAALGFGSQQQDRTGSKNLTMASTTCLSLLLTLSLTSLLCSKKSLIKPPQSTTRVQSGRVIKQRKVRLTKLQPGTQIWWGPQQQSWNPSKNL